MSLVLVKMGRRRGNGSDWTREADLTFRKDIRASTAFPASGNLVASAADLRLVRFSRPEVQASQNNGCAK